MVPALPEASQETKETSPETAPPVMEEDNDSKKDEAERRMQDLKAEMASLKKQLPKSPASQHEEAERRSFDAKSDGHTVKKISDKA